MDNSYPNYAILASGTKLNGGKYVIESMIAQGGFGITYKAIQRGLDRTVCIKEYFIDSRCTRDPQTHSVHPQSISEESFRKYRESFVKEAKTLASLRHPGIVEVMEIFDENNTSYMVMPFIEGRTLQAIVEKRGALEYSEAVNYILQVADAVGYIHDRHILHRDIKPGNIIITSDYKAVLIDFGSAREYVEDKTQAQTSILTHGYAPTEQYSRTSRKGSYTDIYALGATLYFILTGRVPVEAAARLTEPMPEPRELKHNIPVEANRTIMKAMQLKPQDRHQSIKEFMADLQNVNPSSSAKPKKTPSPKPKTKKRNRVPVILAIVMVALLLAGGAVYIILNHHDSPATDEAKVEVPNKKPGEELNQKPPKVEEKTPAHDPNIRYVYANKAYFRKTPNANSNDTTKLFYGSKIQILNPQMVSEDGKNDFYKVRDDYGTEGYVAVDYLMTPSEFEYLDAIYGNQETRKLLGKGEGSDYMTGQSYYKRALLDYFKNNNFNAGEWKIYCSNTNNNNRGFYCTRKKHANNNDNIFAVIIQNTYTGEKRLLCFAFDKKGNLTNKQVFYNPRSEYIRSVSLYNNSFDVYYN